MRVIQGGWLFDGTGQERVPNPGILIRDGLIVQVGLPDDMVLPHGIEVIRLEDGMTILPEFIDLHAHHNCDLVDRGRAEEVRYTGLVFMAALASQVGVAKQTMDAVIHLASVLMQRDYTGEALRTPASQGIDGRTAGELVTLLS